jgi:signal transduction histidine kinase
VTRRILAGTLGITTLALAVFGLPLALFAQRLYRNQAVVRLQEDAAEAGIAVPASFETSDDPVELPPPGDGTRLALYDAEGVRRVGDGPARADPAVTAALRGEASEGAGGGFMVAAVPLTADERVFAAVRAAVPRRAVDARVHRAWLAMAGLAVTALAAAALVAHTLARRLSRPVAALAGAAGRLGDGDFSVRAEASGVPEVDEAAAALNRTAARLGDLLARERAFSADASHQLRTPLTRLRMRLEAALAGAGADREAAVRSTLEEVDRLDATVEDLLALARDTAPLRERLDVAALLAEVERRWHGPLAAAGRPLRVAAASDLPAVEASIPALRQVLDVLIDNAAQHGAGVVTVQARPLAGAVAIEVADEGPGPDGDGEALFRRRAEGARGRGIGLALARSLVEADGGRLVLSRPGPGPCFTVALPAVDASPDVKRPV